ncbi:MAG: ABC transporter substrate-binding protein [Bryobacterales bacterium]|nr:ABC transporter substrate-binding protein [Bryobacterales bacterium]
MGFITRLSLAVALLAALGCTGRVAPEAAKALRYFDLINLDVRDVPLLMALDDLTSQGYKVEKTYLASGALIADALGRGDADIGLVNNQTMWIAATKGVAVSTVMGFTEPTAIIAARSDIKSCRDLDGKRFGMPTTRGLAPALVEDYLQKQCGGAKPNFLVIAESAGRAAALLSGEVDAITAPGEEFLKIQMDAPDKFREVMSYARAYPTIYVEGLHVRRQWATENPNGMKDFVRALLRAQRRVMADPELLFSESVKRLSLDPATAKAVGESHLRNRIWDPNGGLTEKKVEDTLAFLTRIGALRPGVQVKDVADLSYLNTVLDEVGRQ